MPKANARPATVGSALPLRRALLPRDFYLDAPDLVAQRLLGKLLIRLERNEQSTGTNQDTAGRIVEVEAYFGDADPSAHAFAGKTQRNAVLFGPPGHAYVYFIYGMHSCLNVSCEPEGKAGSVLIRALEPVSGIEAMARRRWPDRVQSHSTPPLPDRLLSLASGPGRLCQALDITRARDNGADFTSETSRLQIAEDGFVPHEIAVTPRIGIAKAADRLARFLIAGNPYASKTPTRNPVPSPVSIAKAQML